MQQNLLVVIPAYNEAESLPHILTALQEYGYAAVVIDDASTDNTAAVAEQFGATVLRLPVRIGAWCATQTGLHYGVMHNKGVFVCMDADAQHPVQYIPELLNVLESSAADMVVASDRSRGGALRQITRNALRFLAGLTVYDITSGFRVMTGDVAKLLSAEEMALLDYQDIGPLCKLNEQGMTVTEYPVSFKPRQYGESRIFGGIFSIADYMLQSFLLAVGGATYRASQRTLKR